MSDAMTADQYMDESTPAALRAQLRGARGAARKMMDRIRDQQAEIERLRSRVAELEEWHREGGETTGGVALAYAAEKIAREKAEERLRAVVKEAAAWCRVDPGLVHLRAAGAAVMGILEYGRCERCGGAGCVPVREGGEGYVDCPDCIYGWRPRGEANE